MKLLLFSFLLTLCIGCRLFQPTAYFFISNVSKDKGPVDIQLSIDGKTVFADSIRYSNIRPDLQYTPLIVLPKGKYTIVVTADSGRAKLEQSISLEGNRWIFITYFFDRPVDTSQWERLKKEFGNDTSFLHPIFRGTPSKLGIDIMDREPIHM
ncbi:MAG: hypothetical protein QM726_10780 [Chitinophagaceae bacterium]